MAVKLNGKGRAHAKSLISDGKVDKDSSWSFSAEDGNKILGDPPDWTEYAKWFLGEDASENEETKARYKYPFGKSGKVYRSGVIAAKQRAAQQGESDIADAAGSLLDSIDKKADKALEPFSIERDLAERPYANEHACRLEDPGKFDRFARKNCDEKHDGKCIDVIYGWKGDKPSEIQALRYPKESWTADDARAHCKSRGGTFEAAKEEKGLDEQTVRKIKVGKLYRNFAIEQRQVDRERRTVELSFSSEEPVERWWGMEILDHAKKAVNLRRLKRGGSLLIDHDMTKQVGVIEQVSIDETDRKGRALVRFGKRGLADDTFEDVLDGIKSNVSVGYQIEEMVLEQEKKDAASIYRVTRWEPYEISLVSVPADVTVGVGRADDSAKEIEVRIPPAAPNESEQKPSGIEFPNKEERTMETKCQKCHGNMVDGKCPACEAERQIVAVAGDPAKLSAVELEKRRIKAIENLCQLNNLDDRYKDMWISQGADLQRVSEDLLKIKEERTKSAPVTRIGLVGDETRQFSIVRAIRAIVDKDWGKIAPFELECSRAVAEKLGRTPDPHRFFIPFEVLERPIQLGSMRDRRDVSVGASGGSYLVETMNVGFIEMLRNRSVAFRLGATRLTGLVGNITVPKQSAAGTAYWLSAETTQITEAQQTFVQVGLSPKNVGAYTEISRQLLLQSSPGIEGIVSNDLATIVALAVDVGVLRGSGASGQPQGIVGASGVGSFTGTSLASVGVLDAQTDVAGSNVVPLRPGYVTTSAVAGLLMARPELPSTGITRLWQGSLWDGTIFGLPAMSSEQMASATMLFGDWSSVVVGEWGVLEVEVNPYANFQAGIIGVRAIYSMDVALRYGAAFSYASSIT